MTDICTPQDDTGSAPPFDSNGEGEIYIVWPREFIVAGISVLKPGRSIDSAVRFRAYPKGSRLLVRLRVSRMLDAENMLLGVCKAAFIHRTDIGAEYFEGSDYDIVGMALQVARLFPLAPVPVPLAIVAPTPCPTADRPIKRCRTSHGITAPRPDDELVDALVACTPILDERLRFDPASKTSNANGFLFCNPADNVWRGISNSDVEGVIVDAVKTGSGDMRFSYSELRRIDSRKAARRTVIPTLMCRTRFTESLHAPRNLFAVRNGVLDTCTKTFRPIVHTDHIFVTTPWEYDLDAAIKHRPALDAFIETVFPVEDERRVVMNYIASLVTDHKPIEKLLVLVRPRTDTFDGSSAFIKLVRMFFGSSRAPDVRLVCNTSITPDLAPYRGSRIVIADELRRSTPIDVALLARLTDGSTDSRWHAGFLLAFDQGDPPDLNDDRMLAGRMIVANPSRGPMGLDGGVAFVDWMSALADVLMDHCRDSHLDVPRGMDGWQDAPPTAAMNQACFLANWLDCQVNVTRHRSDYIVMGQLKRVFTESGSTVVSPKDFPRLARAYLQSLAGVSYRELEKITSVVVRGVMRGVQMKDLKVRD